MRWLRRLWHSGDLPWLLAVLGFFALQHRAVVLQGRHWLFGDNAFQNFPWHYFVWDRVRHGGLTAPCREMALGFPLFAEPQAQCFYPLNTALWPIADPFVSFSLKLILHMLGATVGVYVLARWLGRSAMGAAAAALVMCGGSFMVYRVVHAPILFSLAWLPWVVLLYLQTLRTGSRLAFAGLVGCAAMQVLTGHPQLAVYTVLACLIMALGLPTGSTAGAPGRGMRCVRSLGVIAGAYGLGLLISMVQIAPTYELYLYGWRTGLGDIELVRQWGCSLKDLAVNVLAGAEATWKWEKVAFPGTLAWVALLLGLVAWRERPTRALVALVVVGLLLSWSDGNPLYDAIGYVPVLNRFRAPGRAGVLLALGGALLLAWLVDGVRGGEVPPRKLLWGLLAALGLTEAVALTTTGRLGLGPWVAGDPLGWQLAVLVAVAGTCAVRLARTPARGALLAGLLLTLTAGEFLLIARGINPAFTAEEWLQQPDQRIYALAAQKRQADDGAFARWRDGLPNNVAIYFHLPQARGFTPMAFPAMDAMNTWLAGPNTPETLAAFGVDWVATDRERAEAAGLRVVASAGDWVLCRSPLPAERVYIPEEMVPGQLAEAAALLRDETNDPRRTVAAPPAIIGPQPVYCPGGQARLVEDVSGRTVLRTATKAPGLVVVPRLWAPFWSATVDGQPTETLATNMVLLSAVIPAGEHTVTFVWEPEMLRPALVSGLMALLWAVWLVSEYRRTRRARQTSAAGPAQGDGDAAQLRGKVGR